MFKVDLASLEKDRLKAFTVFAKARTQLMALLEKSSAIILENTRKIKEIEEEKQSLNYYNQDLLNHMDKVQKSVNQIDQVIG